MSSQPAPMEWSLEEFDIQPSLWRLIEEFVAEPERPEIKEVIGEGLIDETIVLHEEATSLLDIWRDYRDETEKEEKNLALNRHLSSLPEPPMMRENLKKEIMMFVEMLQQKNNGSQVSKILNHKDESIVDYVLETRSNSSQSQRPSTASSRPSTAMSSSSGRQTPLRVTPRSDASSCASSVSNQLESMNESLNALEIDRIVEHLRGLFVDEKNRLNDDIAFLQDCLFEESDYRQQVLSTPDPEPSLKDLRELGTKLEKEILNNNKIPTTTKSLNKGKPVVFKQHSLDEHSLEYNRNRALPTKPNIPKPPTSPPERKTKTSLPNRTFTISTGGGCCSQKLSPSPPGSASNRNIVPSPPSSAKPQVQRPSSATRFRRMIVECRDSAN
ncbi:uncharacterized protein LOC116300225 [Actinia tenebrosa]|uniref:Uncharacterized protein LOC116300225 n=1 Tax=Actinia tenebrosa TaxID=6105 RepID=A0A6P8IE65_ACTTE|nr:uncharacterized protein LOC116300225 [Actinia tenebrosa]